MEAQQAQETLNRFGQAEQLALVDMRDVVGMVMAQLSQQQAVIQVLAAKVTMLEQAATRVPQQREAEGSDNGTGGQYL